MLGQIYKFYLAFESTNCKQYITKKFFEIALGHNVLTIVMSNPTEDYEKYAPHRMYIYLNDFASSKALTGYLHELDENDELYKAYFKRKRSGEI